MQQGEYTVIKAEAAEIERGIFRRASFTPQAHPSRWSTTAVYHKQRAKTGCGIELCPPPSETSRFQHESLVVSLSCTRREPAPRKLSVPTGLASRPRNPSCSQRVASSPPKCNLSSFHTPPKEVIPCPRFSALELGCG